jgi:hypothetical protein
VAEHLPRPEAPDPQGVKLAWLLRICLALPEGHQARSRWAPPLAEALAMRPFSPTAFGPN